MKNYLVLYDGVCLFCEGWVKFVLNNAPADVNVYFIPLQSVCLSKKIQSDLSGIEDSIICITEQMDFFIKSDASLTVMSVLKKPYSPFAKLALLLPKSFRNLMYDFIGKRRYQIWGKKDQCELPVNSMKEHFVSSEQEIPIVFCKNYKQFFTFC